MLELFMTVILCFFATIGIAHILNRYVAGIFMVGERRLNSPSVVFTVKNRQEDIEATLRSFIWKCFLSSDSGEIMKISVVDLDSEDETMSILKKLECEYEFLSVYDKKSYINKIEREF